MRCGKRCQHSIAYLKYSIFNEMLKKMPDEIRVTFRTRTKRPPSYFGCRLDSIKNILLD